MEDLKSLPSVSRIHFLECQGNSFAGHHINYAKRGGSDPDLGPPVQFIHGGTSCSEWSGVSFSVLLNEAGLQKAGTWLVLEAADQCKFSHPLPVGKALEDCFVAYGQNGDALRIEQGYPIRALVPGWEGPFSVKYLSHIKVTDQPYHTYEGSLNHSSVRDNLGGKARWYQAQWGPKSVITRPSGGMELRKGYVQITGLAWSGGGKVAKVEISTDGGKSWQDATIQGPVHSKAHTRFVYDWVWEGQAATIQSRCTDETGDVQPSVAQLTEDWGMKSLADWQHRPRLFHMNAIQPWSIASDGSISNAMFV
jgi:sulfane dehydrogenase subunit SoxC